MNKLKKIVLSWCLELRLVTDLNVSSQLGLNWKINERLFKSVGGLQGVYFRNLASSFL